MKTRQGFVSNSSSSSFQCCICNRVETDYNLGLPDAAMKQCVNSHTFCNYHETPVTLSLDQKSQILMEEFWYPQEEIDKLSQDEIEGKYDEIISDPYDVPEKLCPICQLEIGTDNNILAYLLIERNITRETVMQEVKERFHDHDGFCKYLTDNTKE